ncbi:hypothetical protein HZC09_05255 [Candidatus Micrarchaeota archaeon]|nr:hypothetical protein [Candidatus Micrarchaeota archaeon]
MVVVDEGHLIADGSRGATLEVVMTKLKRSDAKLLVLSATIPNNKDYAEWLGAKLIESDYRPTPLMMGLCDGKNIYMEDETVQKIEAPAPVALATLALSEKNNKGQALFFTSTRRFTEALAKQLKATTYGFLTEEEKQKCKELSEKALKVLPVPTSQCKILAECLEKGVAYHHAGLLAKQREIIEEGFKGHRCIKAIAATTTLAAGLDLPASWVIVRDLKRYNGDFAEFIPKIECMQMCLPGYSKVLTENGSQRTIAELVEKRERIRLVTINEKTKKTEYKRIVGWNKRYAANLKKIEVEGGASLELTENHPVFALRKDNCAKWLSAADVRTGDRIAVLETSPNPTTAPFMLDYFDDVYVLDAASKVRDIVKRTGKTYRVNAAEFGIKFKTLKEYAYKKAIPLSLFRKLASKAGESTQLVEYVQLIKSKYGKPLALSKHFPPGFFWLVGLIVAEGSLVNYRGRGKWKGVSYQKVKIANGNPMILDEVNRQLSNLGVRHYERRSQSGFKPGRYIDSFEICNQAFSRLLNRFGLVGGRKTHTVSAPESIFQLPNKLVAEYLAGLFDGDGNLSQRNQTIRLCLKSRQMIFDTKSLLTRFGIFSNVYSDKHGNWWLSISSIRDTNLFYDYIPCIRIKPVKRIAKLVRQPPKRFGNLIFKKVVHTTLAHQKRIAVYNLTLKGNANYIANGIVVHNCGRAGRPRFDKGGVGVLVCAPYELRNARDKYIFGELEDIYSQLSSEPSLRAHCLALVASGYSKSFEELFSFFSSTLYAQQYENTEKLLGTVEKVVAELGKTEFLKEKNSKLYATPLGKRVSELYIDPLSASAFLKAMNSNLSEFSFLKALQQASESRPLLRVKKNEEQRLWDEWFALDEEDEEEALERHKTAKMMNAWANEATEEEVMKEFDTPPGSLHARVRIQEWLAYSFSELAFLLNQTTAYEFAKKMHRRIKYGVKEELLPLTSFRGIGRVRARKLWNAGARSKEQYEALGKDEVRRILKTSGDEEIPPEH